MPPEARNCLNITRFWQTSPVATPIPCSFRALLISKVRFFYKNWLTLLTQIGVLSQAEIIYHCSATFLAKLSKVTKWHFFIQDFRVKVVVILWISSILTKVNIAVIIVSARSGESLRKVQTFWEGHKDFKKHPNLFYVEGRDYYVKILLRTFCNSALQNLTIFFF